MYYCRTGLVTSTGGECKGVETYYCEQLAQRHEHPTSCRGDSGRTRHSRMEAREQWNENGSISTGTVTPNTSTPRLLTFLGLSPANGRAFNNNNSYSSNIPQHFYSHPCIKRVSTSSLDTPCHRPRRAGAPLVAAAPSARPRFAP